MKNIILEAYKDVENIQTFTEDAFLTYTKERLRLQEPVVKFIEKMKQEKFDVLDIGSGSSVLSYALHEAGLLKSADCVEPSKSRYEFAQKWKADSYKNSNINNYNIDIQKYNTQGNYDVITIIDNTLSYISIFYAENEIYDIFKSIFGVLKGTGVLIIEVMLFTDIVNQIHASTTGISQKFELGNSIGLWQYKLVQDDVINIESTYIDSDCRVKTKKENSKIFTKNELIDFFLRIGFKDIKFYSDFNQGVYIHQKSDKLVISCKK